MSKFEENLPKTLPVRDFVEQTALGKLHVVEKQMTEKRVSSLNGTGSSI